jgi:uncharacterized membrane protein (DUF2068 family)
MNPESTVLKHHQAGMVLIAGVKIVKGVLGMVLGLGLLKLVHADVATLFSQLLEALNLGADSRLIHALVLKVDALQPQSLLTMSVASFTYGGLELTEGLGLWFERAWAAYLTVISTSLFIPFELYEIVEKVTVLRVGALLGNVAIVLYLISQLKHHSSKPRHFTGSI